MKAAKTRGGSAPPASKSTAAVATPAPVATRFRDRIQGLRRVKASELVRNEKNWRLHPEEQRGAMTTTLQRIGITGALVAREMADGKLQLLDGHLRADIAEDELVPVLVVDLNDKEADEMLATFDPLSDLALMDTEALRKLLENVDTDEDAFLRQMMAGIDQELAAEHEKAGVKPHEVEGMALEPHEHYDYLVVLATTSHEWNVLCERLGLKPEARRAKMGTSRAIRAVRLLNLINEKA